MRDGAIAVGAVQSFLDRDFEGLKFSAVMVASDQVADIFAVVREVTGFNLRFDPLILLIRDSDGFSGGARCRSPKTPKFKLLMLLSTFHHTFAALRRQKKSNPSASCV